LAAAEYIILSDLHSSFSLHQDIHAARSLKASSTNRDVSVGCGISHIDLLPTVPLSKNQKSPPKHAMSAEKSCQKASLGLTMDTKVSLE